ncbi:MAG: hypothetical protein A2V88_02655 [Elusimicrobia bacterium RBG_16_66_12]|nr:MAG: hypothetical protein A2V88_02655 [Elusimicrobia bacterium RBG_16_66_12]
MIPFPFEASGNEDIVERVEFLTDVLISYDATEQRVQLRGAARRAIEYSIFCDDQRAAQHAEILLYGLQHDLLGVPLWQYANKLTAQAGSGATSFTVEIADVPWATGDTVFLFSDPFTWDALAFSSASAGTVFTLEPSTRIWPIGTVVVPMRAGRVAASVPYAHESRDAIGARVHFLLEPAL